MLQVFIIRYHANDYTRVEIKLTTKVVVVLLVKRTVSLYKNRKARKMKEVFSTFHQRLTQANPKIYLRIKIVQSLMAQFSLVWINHSLIGSQPQYQI